MDEIGKLFEHLEDQGQMTQFLVEKFVVIMEKTADLCEQAFSNGFEKGAQVAFDQVPMDRSTRQIHMNQIPELLAIQIGTIKATRPKPEDYGLHHG